MDYIAFQKEAFGFYFSKHPLEHYQEEYKALGLVPINGLEAVRDGDCITIGGIVNWKKIKKDRKGRNYAIINLEDFDGSIDVFVFSEQFEKNAQVLKIDTPIIIKGKISGDEDRKSLRAEHIVLFREAKTHYKKIYISFDSASCSEKQLKNLHELLAKNQGQCEVWFKVNGEDQCRNIRSRSIKINPEADVLTEIKNIVGADALRIIGRI